MPEEIKFKILRTLESSKKKTFTPRELSELVKCSYPTVLKWIAVLGAEDSIKIEDYGNIKLIKWKE